MEFKQVAGLRRSIRFWQPWRPVEDSKIQTILEAIYRAPRILEVDFTKVGVLRREQISDEDFRTMKGPTTTTQVDLCPLYIWVYADMEALESACDGHNLRELIEAGILGAGHGWTVDRVESAVIPNVYRRVLEETDRIPITRGPVEGEPVTYPRGLVALARWQQGIAHEHALLTAVDEGLGIQLSAVNPNIPKKIMGIPDTWMPSMPLLVGYPAESLEAGGQRPREPLGEDFYEGRFGNPFAPDPAVDQRLWDEGLFRRQDLPWRRAELRRLSRMFGLPE